MSLAILGAKYTPQDPGECSICFRGLDGDPDAVFHSRCGNAFHRGCMDSWVERQRRCPVCRRSWLVMAPIAQWQAARRVQNTGAVWQDQSNRQVHTAHAEMATNVAGELLLRARIAYAEGWTFREDYQELQSLPGLPPESTDVATMLRIWGENCTIKMRAFGVFSEEGDYDDQWFFVQVKSYVRNGMLIRVEVTGKFDRQQEMSLPISPVLLQGLRWERGRM